MEKTQHSNHCISIPVIYTNKHSTLDKRIVIKKLVYHSLYNIDHEMKVSSAISLEYIPTSFKITSPSLV